MFFSQTGHTIYIENIRQLQINLKTEAKLHFIKNKPSNKQAFSKTH